MEDDAGDVVEGELRLRLRQLHGQEPLPVVQELHLVGGGLELARPRPRPAAARQELEGTACNSSRFFCVLLFGS